MMSGCPAPIAAIDGGKGAPDSATVLPHLGRRPWPPRPRTGLTQKKCPYREYLAYTLSVPPSMPAFSAPTAQVAYFAGSTAVQHALAAGTIQAHGP